MAAFRLHLKPRTERLKGELRKRRIHQLRKQACVEKGRSDGLLPYAIRLRFDDGDVEADRMADQRTLPNETPEFDKRMIDGLRAEHVGIRQAVDGGRFSRDRQAGIDQHGEIFAIGGAARCYGDGADLNDPRGAHIEPGRLQIKRHRLNGQQRRRPKTNHALSCLQVRALCLSPC